MSQYRSFDLKGEPFVSFYPHTDDIGALMFMPQYGFGSWLKKNATGLLKGAGSLVKLIPGVGTIAGPLLDVAGSAVAGAQQHKADQAAANQAQAELNAKMAADKQMAYNNDVNIREKNLFSAQDINYGGTFAYGGDLFMEGPDRPLLSNDPRYAKPTPHVSNPNFTPISPADAKKYKQEDLEIVPITRKRGTDDRIDGKPIQYYLKNYAPEKPVIPMQSTPIVSAPSEYNSEGSVYDIVDGKLVFMGKEKDYRSNPDIRKAYGGDLMPMNNNGISVVTLPPKAYKHNEGIGGVPVDIKGNPTKMSNQSMVGMVEGGELIFNGFVFSNNNKMKIKKHGDTYTS